MNQPLYYDITHQFQFIFDRFLWAVEWSKLHGVMIGTNLISFFDLAIGVFCIWLLTLFIPIFDDAPITDDDKEGW